MPKQDYFPISQKSLTAAEQEIIAQAVNKGAKDYFESCRRRVYPFVEKHYSLKGALRINRKAFGKDMLRAPANLLWAMPYVSIRVSSSIFRIAGLQAVSEKLNSVPPGFRTQVQKEVELLVKTELFELSCEQDEHNTINDALLNSILAQEQLSHLLAGYLHKIDQLATRPELQTTLTRQFARYVDTRIAASDLACGVITLSGGAAVFKQLTPGALSTGSAIATAIAQQSAISHFVFGPTIGSLYYSAFPAAASLDLLAASTTAVLATLGVISAFSGIVTDPVQKQLGVHKRRLHKLINTFEQQFFEESGAEFHSKDHYIARIFDLFDLLKTASTTLR